jgi:hypothetical protein
MYSLMARLFMSFSYMPMIRKCKKQVFHQFRQSRIAAKDVGIKGDRWSIAR